MKIFYSLVVSLLLSFGIVPASADQSHPRCDHLCQLYTHARVRTLHPTLSPLVCVNFTLVGQGGKVTVRVSLGNKVVIEDAKRVATREGQFCYPRALWLKEGGEPDKVFLCSEHSVTLPWKETPISDILSGRGDLPKSYACLRGIKGCGSADIVTISRQSISE